MTLDKAKDVLSDVGMKKYAVIALLLYCSMLIYIYMYAFADLMCTHNVDSRDGRKALTILDSRLYRRYWDPMSRAPTND